MVKSISRSEIVNNLMDNMKSIGITKDTEGVILSISQKWDVEGKDIINKEVINNMLEDPYYVHEEYFKDIKLIVRDEFNVDLSDVFFIPRIRENYASIADDIEDGSRIIIFDDYLDTFFWGFYFWSSCMYIENCSEEHDKFCIEKLSELIRNFIKKEKDSSDIDFFITTSENPEIVNFSNSIYWGSWIFIVSHELAHLILEHPLKKRNQILDTISAEYQADELGYKVFNIVINNKDFINKIKVFHSINNVPLIILEIYELIDTYKKNVFKMDVVYNEHPSPELRRSQLEKMFYNVSTLDDKEIYNAMNWVIGYLTHIITNDD